MEKSGAGAVAGNHAGHLTVITDDGIANSIQGKSSNSDTAHENSNFGHKTRFFNSYKYKKIRSLLGYLINKIKTTGGNT